MLRAPNRHPTGRAAAPALLTAALLTACSGPTPQPAAPVTPPTQTLAAEALARQEFGLLAGGGWAQAWQLWPPDAQQAISQGDFVRLNTECRPLLGLPYVIDRSTKTDPDTVRVDWHRAELAGSSTVVHRDGRWQFTPDAAALTDYRLGVDRLVERRKAAGSCH
ncbi:hypothetical protein ABT095_30310 [Kitasatospora sp. NPDC002227]|uniref:hypothetical protein n=1 Tax=Kitasatospora sp. NPDC002227 TaxID=3154773 RepID=UPI0033199824